jgi:hypothetical protein
MITPYTILHSIHCPDRHTFPSNCKESVVEYEGSESGASRTELVVWAKAEMKCQLGVDRNGVSSKSRLGGTHLIVSVPGRYVASTKPGAC